MARRNGLRYLPSYGLTAAIGLAVAVATIIAGLATNAASESEKWPGPLEHIHQHPFRALVVFGAFLFLLPFINTIFIRTGPEPANTEDLSEAEERIHDRFDTIELGQLKSDDNTFNRLPPYAREILKSDVDIEDIWPLIKPFANEALNPLDIAKEWAVEPPGTLDTLTGSGRLVVAEILLAHGQHEAAGRHLDAAINLGVSPRPYWLFRAAQISWTLQGEDSIDAIQYLDRAATIDPRYPIVQAVKLMRSGSHDAAYEALKAWTPTYMFDFDARASVLASIAIHLDRIDDAVNAYEEVADTTDSAGLLLSLANLLQHRSYVGGGDSRWSDAFRAIDVSIRARNLRQAWRGDSASAVASAGESALLADDAEQCWSLTRPMPEGQATEHEASDARVLPIAAMCAAVTGRIAQARELSKQTADGYTKLRIEAEIASAESRETDRRAAISAWRRVLAEATTDTDQLRALRALAMEGYLVSEVNDDVRTRHPAAIADIEATQKVMQVASTDDAGLRRWEPDTALASIRRADILRENGEALKAAQVLVDAMARWQNPRLLLLAIDCYMDAGAWENAETVALEVLAESGTLWPGRATVLRRLFTIEMVLENWAKAARACRSLLEIDADDRDARWGLAFAEFRNGDPDTAWRTIQRIDMSTPATDSQALLTLELKRRFSSAQDIALSATSMLQAFPNNEQIHAAAINAITFRVDRSELPEDLGREATEIWSKFFEQFPDSTIIRTFTIQDHDNPLAEAEGLLKQQAHTYRQAIEMVRDQVAPIGLLDKVAGKPYAAIFPYRPLGYHRAETVFPQDVEVEGRHADEALEHGCLIDASALYTLTFLGNLADKAINMPARVSITASGLNDLIAGDEYFGMPTLGTIGYDPDNERPFVTESDQDVRDQQAKTAKLMLRLARSLHRIHHPALLHLKKEFPNDAVWLLTVDAAKGKGLALWSDDIGLRRLAHGIGVKTFGTWSLLTAAERNGRLSETEIATAKRDLIRNHVVDLPFDAQMLAEICEEQHWAPNSVATVLSRPTSWDEPRAPSDILMRALRRSTEETALPWAHAALHGLLEASTPEFQISNLEKVVTALMSEPFSGPMHFKALADAVKILVPDTADAIIRNSVRELWKKTLERHAPSEAVLIIQHLVRSLDDSTRQFAVSLLLQRRPK